MALRAVVHEQTLANRHRLRIAGHFFWLHRAKARVQRLQLGVGLGYFFVVGASLAPAQQAFIGAHAGVCHQIAQSKDNR